MKRRFIPLLKHEHGLIRGRRGVALAWWWCWDMLVVVGLALVVADGQVDYRRGARQALQCC